jgi:hypothetical protein
MSIMLLPWPALVLKATQALLFFEDEAGHSKARDSIAAAVTRQRGECIVLFGRHPPHDALYAATGTLEESASDDTWTGEHLSEEQLKQVISRLNKAVDQIGGKVSNSPGGERSPIFSPGYSTVRAPHPNSVLNQNTSSNT